MLVSKENWQEVKKDIESGVTRVRLRDDNMVWVTTESFNGYTFPLRFLKKLLRDGEVPETLMKHLSGVT